MVLQIMNVHSLAGVKLEEEMLSIVEQEV